MVHEFEEERFDVWRGMLWVSRAKDGIVEGGMMMLDSVTQAENAQEWSLIGVLREI